MDGNTHRGESGRLLEIAIRLITNRDFLGSKTFAIRAKDSDPSNPLPDQILAVIETILAWENRLDASQHQPDWYAVLQLPRLVRDPELIASHYRRLAMLLNPDTNRVPFAEYAVRVVMEAWGVLSDPSKKWVFDNELAGSLQRGAGAGAGGGQGPVRVEAVRVEVDHRLLSGSSSSQPQSLPTPTLPMWQQQPQHQPQENQNYHQHHQPPHEISNNNNSQLHQIEFMQPPLPQPQKHQQPPPQPQKHQQPPPQPQKHQSSTPQWQIRDPTLAKGERSEEFLSGIGGRTGTTPTTTPVMGQVADTTSVAAVSTPTRTIPRPAPAPLQPPPAAIPVSGIGGRAGTTPTATTPIRGWATDTAPVVAVSTPTRMFPPPTEVPQKLSPAAVPASGISVRTGTTTPTATTPIIERVADTAAEVLTPTQTMPRPAPVPQQPPPVAVTAKRATVPTIDVLDISDGDVDDVYDDDDDDDDDDDGDDDDGVLPDNDFCNNADVATNENDDQGAEEELEGFWTACPYCFYIFEYQKKYKDCTLRCRNCRRAFHGLQIPTPPSVAGADAGGEKGKESSFCSWGVFPVGFSTAAWKKNNQMGKSSVASNWVPFSPLIACPVGKGAWNFPWFSSSGAASVGPKNMGRPLVSQPKIYRDDINDDFVSDPSDSDSSDREWRKIPAQETQNKNKRKGAVGGGGRPRKANRLDMPTIVLALTAGAKEVPRKKVSATLTKSQAKRRVKDVGRLDLNVEFNNEGDEQAPRVRAVNGEEDGIENIGFFEGLDEFFSTLPILTAGEGEKAKPSS